MSIDGEFSLGVDGSCSEGHELRLGGRFLQEYGWGLAVGCLGIFAGFLEFFNFVLHCSQFAFSFGQLLGSMCCPLICCKLGIEVCLFLL